MDYIPCIGGLANNLTVLTYSHSMEKQANLFGTRLLAATGFVADEVHDSMVTINFSYLILKSFNKRMQTPYISRILSKISVEINILNRIFQFYFWYYNRILEFFEKKK